MIAQAQGLQRTADNGRSEGGRLFMVIICPIGWGMAQRGARVNIKNASCNYNVTLARQIDEAESQLTWSTGCSPSGSSSCDIQDRPQSTLRPGWQNGQDWIVERGFWIAEELLDLPTFTFSTRLKHLWRERLCRTAF